jgi:prepilin-type N-terminal cleavage/methylation domain-containing protein
MTSFGPRHSRHGFTLIELSIVLVIIGLVVGGVLVGNDLIKAAEIRAIISQKDKYLLAVNTFKLKYNALPGDMSVSQTSQLGFFTFTGSNAGKNDPFSAIVGYGDNNGQISMLGNVIESMCTGECGAVFPHLSQAGLVDGSYGNNPSDSIITNTDGGLAGLPTSITGFLNLSTYMPIAKNGRAYFGIALAPFSIYAAYRSAVASVPIPSNKHIMYLIGPFDPMTGTQGTAPALSGIEMQQIDAKLDDGKPNTGQVIGSSRQEGYEVEWWNGTAAPVFFSERDSSPTNLGCTKNGTNAYSSNVEYNTTPATGGNAVFCFPLFLW